MPDPDLSSSLPESYDSAGVEEPNPYEPLESPAPGSAMNPARLDRHRIASVSHWFACRRREPLKAIVLMTLPGVLAAIAITVFIGFYEFSAPFRHHTTL